MFEPSCFSVGRVWALDMCAVKPLDVLCTLIPSCHVLKGHVRRVTARLLRPTVSTSSLQIIAPKGRGVSPVVFSSLHAAKPNVPAFDFGNLKCRPGLWPQPVAYWADEDQWELFDSTVLVSMENGGVTMVYHRTFKPQGKMRRRVKDLRIASFSYLDTVGCRAQLDLSHNESVRLAVDSLLTQGLEAYHKMLNAEGEVDFLSELEKSYVLQNGTDGCTGCECWHTCVL